MSIEIVTFVNDFGPLTKAISLDEDGALRSDSWACRMSRGCARRVAIGSIEDLGELIGEMRSNQALALGSLRAGLPDEIEVVTKRALGGTSSAITRTKDDIHYRPGAPGFVLTDADTRGMPGADAKRPPVGFPVLVCSIAMLNGDRDAQRLDADTDDTVAAHRFSVVWPAEARAKLWANPL